MMSLKSSPLWTFIANRCHLPIRCHLNRPLSLTVRCHIFIRGITMKLASLWRWCLEHLKGGFSQGVYSNVLGSRIRSLDISCGTRCWNEWQRWRGVPLVLATEVIIFEKRRTYILPRVWNGVGLLSWGRVLGSRSCLLRQNLRGSVSCTSRAPFPLVLAVLNGARLFQRHLSSLNSRPICSLKQFSNISMPSYFKLHFMHPIAATTSY
jgi:hypothetical protein